MDSNIRTNTLRQYRMSSTYEQEYKEPSTYEQIKPQPIYLFFNLSAIIEKKSVLIYSTNIPYFTPIILLKIFISENFFLVIFFFFWKVACNERKCLTLVLKNWGKNGLFRYLKKKLF